MFVAPCPHCGDSVTVPTRARPTSRVRCPLCTTEFTLDEMMAKLPPALELLDEPVGTYADSERSYAAYAGGDSDVATLVATDSGDAIALADAERAEKPSYSFDAGDGGTATAEGPRKSVRTTPRPKKPKKNALLEGVKIILGGLMALPISQLILWWAAGKDPFDMGPVIAKNVPQIAFIVPAKLRTDPTVKKSDTGGDPKPTTKPTAKNNSRPAGLPKLDNNEMPKLEFPSDPAVLDPGVTDPAADPLAIPKIDIEPLALPGEEKKADPFDPAPLPEPTVDPAPAPAVEPAPAAAEVVRNAPQYTAAEVEEAAKNASKAAQTWTEGAAAATTEQKAELLRALYMSLAQLGEKVAYANRADTKLENHLPTVREVLYSLQAEADVLTMVSRVGPVWLNPKARKSDGILLIGTVKEVTPQGQAFATTVELDDKSKTKLAIVSTSDPADSYKVDDRVMVLGVIVSEPSNIVGYEGTAPLAVLSGMAVRVAQ